MSNDHGQIILLLGVCVASTVWLATLILWMYMRRPKPMKTVQQRVPGADITKARDTLAKGAALMTPVWDLVGGEAEQAEFDIPIRGRQRVRVELQQEDDAVVLTCNATPTAGWVAWVVPACLVIQPLIIFGLGYVIWINVNAAAAPRSGGRAYQIFQLCYILLPPFIFMRIGWSLRREVRQQCDRFLTSISLLLDP